MTVLGKELLERLQTVQFFSLLAVSLVVFGCGAIGFVASYPPERAFYAAKVAEADRQPSTIGTNLYRPPQLLRFVADGGDRYRPFEYRLGTMGQISPMSSRPGNQRLLDVPEMDWAFIVKVIFSFYAVLLGFDAVAGERESGTLTLVLANPIRRGRLLASKFGAILLSALIPLCAGLLLHLTIIGSFEPQVLMPSQLLRIASAGALMVTYVSIFALLSVLCSALIRRSSLVLLVLLGAWVVLAVIVPNVSGIVSQAFARVPTELQFARMVDPMIKEQVWGRIREIQSRVSSGAITSADEVRKEADRAYEAGARALEEHHEAYRRAIREQEATARRWSRLSPAALLQYALEGVAMTGSNSEEAFRREAIDYSHVYDAYVEKKVGKLVRSSGYRFGTGIIFKGAYLDVSSPVPTEYSGDQSDFPHFALPRLSFPEALRNALGDLVGLLSWNIVLAVLALLAFGRMDVR